MADMKDEVAYLKEQEVALGKVGIASYLIILTQSGIINADLIRTTR